MEADPGALPSPIVATAGDLPAPVAMALARPGRARPMTVAAAGYRFAVRTWGRSTARPLLLVHGVTSSSETWWRIGPALAASGRRVVAPDLPGHGDTGGWIGRSRFSATAADLAAFVRAAGLGRADLDVVGHSWGGLVCAALPAVGLRPRRLVLLDPPALPLAYFREYVKDPLEQPYASLAEARAVVRAANPGWLAGDVRAKADGLTRFQVEAARSVVLENGDWDAGLSALADRAAGGLPVWLVKGEATSGSMIPDSFLPALAARLGPDHVLTIAGGEHSPQRLTPEATLVALLRALGD